jgi:hypothetical protein
MGTTWGSLSGVGARESHGRSQQWACARHRAQQWIGEKNPLMSGTCEGGGANDWWTPAVHTDRVASGSDQVNGSGPRGQKNFSEFLFFFQSTQKSK